MLTNASSPYAIQSALPTTFYRVTRPRPVNLYIPSSYDGQTPVPLVILLHGYGFTGVDQENYMHFRPLAEARGFLYCYPDSLRDRVGIQFWNATDSCCDYFNTATDDAGYLRELVEAIGRQFALDRRRIFLIGCSAGGSMTYRMACQSSDIIAGIASLSGETFLDPSRCAPSEPVNILEIRGTADNIVPYAGGAVTTTGQTLQATANMPAFPGALRTVQTWAGYNGARDPVTDPGPSMDIDLDVPGLDTVITRYANHRPGGAVELWTINGGGHGPNLYSGSSSSEFAPRVIDWLLAHPKP
jgi:polyhydroxybutyrate depolymerase